MVLFYVTPVTVCLALLALLVFSLVLARDQEGAGWSRPLARGLLGVTAAAYLLVLAAPLTSWGQAEAGSRHVVWNPLSAIQELRQEAVPVTAFGQQLSTGELAYYSVDPLSHEERAEILDREPYDFFAHGAPGTDPVVLDAEGRPAPSDGEGLVEREMGESIARAGEPMESAAMIVEEKVLHTLLFVPLGILAFHAFSSWTVRVVAGPGFSAVVEASQWAAGDLADTGDVLANTAGSLAGVAMAGGAAALVHARRRARRAEDPQPLEA
ncbi:MULTISPECIES: VanZ family protein [Nocardiopsis]|nr:MULTISPECIES: VanZ family protein [Nocardiopsis]